MHAPCSRAWPAAPPFLYSRASGSVVLWCVSFERFSLWKRRSALRPGPSLSLSPPSFLRKLLIEAHASISGASTEK